MALENFVSRSGSFLSFLTKILTDVRFSLFRFKRKPNNSKETEKKKPFFSKSGEKQEETFFQSQKMEMGKKDDEYEKEADRVANNAVQKSTQLSTSQKESNKLQRITLATPPEYERLGTAEQRIEEDKRIQKMPDTSSEKIDKMDTPPLRKSPDEKSDALQAKQEEEPIQSKSAEEITPAFRAKDQPDELIHRKEDTAALQPQEESPNRAIPDKAFIEQLEKHKGRGQKMAPKVQAEMEALLGHCFEEVNIHTGKAAAELCQAVNAQAFAQGNDIFFNEGKYNPQTAQGKFLLAHELAHVIQQNQNLDPIISKKNEKETSITNKPNLLRQFQNQFAEYQLLLKLYANGIRAVNPLTNELFYVRYPKQKGKRLKTGSMEARQWVSIRNTMVIPFLTLIQQPKEREEESAQKSSLKLINSEILEPLKDILTSLMAKFRNQDQEEREESKAILKDTLQEAIAMEAELKKKYPKYGSSTGHEGYGSDQSKDQYVCTTFAAEVLRRAGYTIDDETDTILNINNINYKKESGKKKPSLKDKQTVLQKLINQDDARLKGIVKALVDSGQGKEITKEELQPGDFVQYWYRSGGKIGGHVVQVEKVLAKGKRISAHGSHHSKHGVGRIRVWLVGKRLLKVYAVRPKGSPHYK